MPGSVQRLTSSETTPSILHDLNGPLINIDAFSREVRKSLTELHELVMQADGSHDDKTRHTIESIFENDLYFCLNCIEISIKDLREKHQAQFGSEAPGANDE